MEISDTFKDVIITFLKDLNITFPEYNIFWDKWINANEKEMKELFEYMLKVFPERMFDILTQNENIFEPNGKINTVFLPNIEFKLLFNTNGITENTKQTIWKYLQLIMMSLMSSIKNKSQFGETEGIFETINEEFLQEKLNETILKMGDFFDSIKSDDLSKTDLDENEQKEDDKQHPFNESLPNPEKLFEHLQSLFNGKIGSLAKEFAEEFSNDMKDILNEDDLKNVNSVKDILPKLLKDPKKLLTLIKSIHEKVNNKMEKGEISRDELINETQEMMKKMGGIDNFADMLKGMADKMGMGGKNVRIDKNALKKMESEMKMKEQLRKKLELRKKNILKNEKISELNCNEENKDKTYLEQNAEIDKIMNDFDLLSNNTISSNKQNKKKKRTKK